MKTLEEQIALIADEAERQLAESATVPRGGNTRYRWLAAAAAFVLAGSLGAGLWALAQRSGADTGTAGQPAPPTTVVLETDGLASSVPGSDPSATVVVPEPTTTATGPAVDEVPVTVETIDDLVPEPTTTASDPAGVRELAPVPENEPTVVADSNELWTVPTDLPDDLSFDVAVEYGFGGEEEGRPERSIDFRSDVEGREISVTTDAFWIGLNDDPDVETIDIGGVEWTIKRTQFEDEPMSVTLERVTEESSVSIRASGVAESVVLQAAVSLVEVPATELQRPPLTVSVASGKPVAETTQNGVTQRLLVETDGTYFSMTIGGGGGSPAALDGAITADGASSSPPDLVADGQEAESLIWGLVHPDVASVEVELTDGRVVVSEPQDQYGFNENFFVIAFPTRTEMGLELLAAVVARDADGNELGRDTSFSQ